MDVITHPCLNLKGGFGLTDAAFTLYTLQWRHDKRNGVSNHHRLDYLLNRLFRRRSKKTSKLCVTGLCEGNPPVTTGVPSQRTSNMENVSIWWRHHDIWVITSHCFYVGLITHLCTRRVDWCVFHTTCLLSYPDQYMKTTITFISIHQTLPHVSLPWWCYR